MHFQEFMILLLLFLEKSHSIKDSESQIYNIHFSLNNETLILFSRKIIYEYARDESFALPTILLDAKTLLTHKGHPKTYKKYEIFCEFHAFCLSLHQIDCIRQFESRLSYCLFA